MTTDAPVLQRELDSPTGRPEQKGSVPVRRTPPLLMAAGVAVALLALVPLGFVVAYTVIIGPAEASPQRATVRAVKGSRMTSRMLLSSKSPSSSAARRWQVER